MVKAHECPRCGSNHWDYSNTGLPDALQCTDCGCVYPEVLSLFPKVIKTETNWPFPTSLVKKPLNDIPAKIDGLKDAQEAPF